MVITGCEQIVKCKQDYPQYTLRELILARTYFGEFGGLVEFSFQLSYRCGHPPNKVLAKINSLNVG